MPQCSTAQPGNDAEDRGDEATMIIWIQGILAPDELATVARGLSTAEFVSGSRTAGKLNLPAKENLELRQNWPGKERLDQIVLKALQRNQTFEIAARPKKIIAPIYSRYTAGMHYGSHLDNAIMDRERRLRIDLSLTLFLSGPDSYDGGELVIETEYGPKSVKLPAGDGIVYPTIYYHEVKPVTRGERCACITWIQSLVRDIHKRQILYDMSVLAEWIHAQAPGSPQFRQFNKIQANLYRIWADD
jgi:PKHD-type hydroxylase